LSYGVDAIVDVPNSTVGLPISPASLLAEHHPMGQRCLGDRQYHRGRHDGAAARTGISSR
jgi:hypothetical protein